MSGFRGSSERGGAPKPGPLELSLSPEDGSLLTAPLRTVLLSATDSLYGDLHDMTYGELNIVVPTTTAAATEGDDNGNEETDAAVSSTVQISSQTRKEKMASLSFAQRRHELASRIARHGKSFSHVAGLVDAYGLSRPKRHEINAGNKKPNPADGEMAESVKTSSDAFAHVRSSWVQADEAQDALYFHHAELWKARRHPHDVLGALSTLNCGTWTDFPRDVELRVDRYEQAAESGWSKTETSERLRGSVRRKLVLGEVGSLGVASSQDKPWWRVALEPGGGVVHLSYGSAREGSRHGDAQRQPGNQDGVNKSGNSENAVARTFPIEARVTVLSAVPDAEWALLSVGISVEAKTGESNHQLDVGARQLYDLHRLAARGMAVEEARVRKRRRKMEEKGAMGDLGESGSTKSDDKTLGKYLVARPLDSLFEILHTFSLSLQLEVLSAQSEALKRGVWANSKVGIAVSPVFFHELQRENGGTGRKVRFESTEEDSEDEVEEEPLAVLAVHFWSVDDRNGSPVLGKLTTVEEGVSLTSRRFDHIGDKEKKPVNISEMNSSSSMAPVDDDTSSISSSVRSSDRPKKASGKASIPGRHHHDHLVENDFRYSRRLTLCIRAIPKRGILVSLSGGDGVMSSISSCEGLLKTERKRSAEHVKRNVDRLLEHVQNPFRLSASDALLAAAVICAERRCCAVVTALQCLGKTSGQPLPKWVHLDVDCGTISVAVDISYDGDQDSRPEPLDPVLIFRLGCDSRTGNFVTTFPRPAILLRSLACNDVTASDFQIIRHATISSQVRSDSSASSIRRSAAAASRELTGRAVRDAFDGLARSVDVLGRRAGVGGEWQDNDTMSGSLRERAIELACLDVRASLTTCAGAAIVYGLAALASGVCLGVDAVADMAGGALKEDECPHTQLLPLPPLSCVLGQNMVEKITNTSDDEKKTISILERDLVAIGSSISDDSLTLHMFNITTQVQSPTIAPNRTHCSRLPLLIPTDANMLEDENDLVVSRPKKRSKLGPNTNDKDARHRQLLDEVDYLTPRFEATLENRS